MFVCRVHIFSIFIAAGEPLNTVFLIAAGEPLNTVFLIAAGEPLNTVFLIAAGEPLNTLFSVFPPVILLAAEGLGNAVHCLAEGNGDLLVLATVLVLPRGDQEQPICGT